MEHLHPYIPENMAQEYDSPMIRVTTLMGDLVLDHLNSRIRIFDNEEFNHVEYKDDSGQLRAFTYTNELFEWLMENDWRYEYLPYIDTSTQSWWEEVQVQKMTQALGELGFDNV